MVSVLPHFSTMVPGIDEMYFGETVTTLAGHGPIGTVIVTADRLHLLPEAYLFGFALSHSQAHPAFLAGRYSLTGWWYFFPYCFLVKTPLPTLAILAIASVTAASRMYAASRGNSARIRLRCAFYRLAPLYSLVTVYWLVAISSSLNIGEPHFAGLPANVCLGGCSLAHGARRVLQRRPM